MRVPPSGPTFVESRSIVSSIMYLPSRRPTQFRDSIFAMAHAGPARMPARDPVGLIACLCFHQVTPFTGARQCDIRGSASAASVAQQRGEARGGNDVLAERRAPDGLLAVLAPFFDLEGLVELRGGECRLGAELAFD